MSRTESTMKRYEQLQSLLKSCYPSHCDEFDLDEMSGDFIVLDEEKNDLFIKYLPTDGDTVVVSDMDGNNRHNVPLSMFSEQVTERILQCMTKAFIVNEIKVHL